MKKETVLEAFLRQTGIDPNNYDQTEEHAKLYGEGLDEGLIERLQTQKLRTQAGANMFNPKPISESVDIPSQLKSGEIDQKTEVSSQFKNYDHSLEEDRWSKIGGKDCEEGDDGIIMEEI